MKNNILVRTAPTQITGNRMRLALLVGLSLLLVASLLAFTSHAFAAPEAMLNLSHIECAGQQVEVHFVVVNLPDGITPGALTFYGTWPGGNGSETIPAPTAHTGNVYHYSWYGSDGYYEITGGEVQLSDGSTLSLHNPGEYTGDYMCQCGGTASCSGWEFHFMHPLRTDATITVYALISGHMVQVGSGSAVANQNPMTVVTGGWDMTMPVAQTDIRFLVNYGGRTYIEKATKPECPTAAGTQPTVTQQTKVESQRMSMEQRMARREARQLRRATVLNRR